MRKKFLNMLSKNRGQWVIWEMIWPKVHHMLSYFCVKKFINFSEFSTIYRYAIFMNTAMGKEARLLKTSFRSTGESDFCKISHVLQPWFQPIVNISCIILTPTFLWKSKCDSLSLFCHQKTSTESLLVFWIFSTYL